MFSVQAYLNALVAHERASVMVDNATPSQAKYRDEMTAHLRAEADKLREATIAARTACRAAGTTLSETLQGRFNPPPTY